MFHHKTSSALRSMLLAAAATLTLATSALAQFNASLSGTVQDASGASIPGATVTLTNRATQVTQTTTSTGEGFYKFNSLPPAHYKIAVQANGFKASNFDDVSLDEGAPRNVDVKLSTGGASEQVTVSADQVPLLQTSDANIQTTIDSEEIKRLPTFAADPYELLRTAPGIIGDGARSGSGQAVFLPNGGGPGGSNSGVYQTENQVQISADGQRQADNNFTIDGVSVNSLTHGGAAVVSPNQEAVGSLTIVSTSYDASDGRNSGAQIKVVTQSGTNKVHGSGFFLYDEPGFNSFNKYGGPIPGTLPSRVNLKQRSYAASLGGPILRDKLFLFGSFAGFTLANNTTTTAYVETPQFRASVIANRAGGVTAGILADPAVQPRILKVITPTCTGLSATQCQVVPGGLDLGSLTTGAGKTFGYFPTSMADTPLDGVPDVQNVQLSVPSHSRGRQFNGRMDFQVTQKDLLAGSVYFTKLDNYGTSGSSGSRPQADLPFKPLNSAGTLIYIHTFGPSWLNELRANGTRFAENGLTDAGNTVDFGTPFVNVQGYPFSLNYGANFSSTSPAIFAENTYEGRDVVTHTFGSHTVRAGAELRLEQDNDNLLGQQRPIYAFGSLFAFANDASVFEQVSANPLTGGVANAQRYFRSEDIAAYVQHDWKVSPNLTINMGLRWEEFTPLRNKGSKINSPVLGTTPGRELVDISLQPKDTLWAPRHNNYAPKFAFAYAPTSLTQKAVIRGGFAMAYNHLDVALFNNAFEDGPGFALFNLCCGGNGNKAGIQYNRGTTRSPASFPINPTLKTGIGPNGFPLQLDGTANQRGVEVYGVGKKIDYPMSYLYSTEIQYELPKQMTFTMGYAGSVGHHFARLVNQNFIYNECFPATDFCNGSKTFTPVYASYFAQTDSNQNFNALNLQLRRRLTHGIAFSAFYTYSKSLDQVSNGDGANSNANQTNPANNATEYGRSDYDARHHVTATALYEVPKFHTSSKLVGALVNGFQINTILTYHTGFPWTPVTYNIQTNPNQIGAARAGPVRPTAYNGQAGNSCSNSAYTSGSNFPNRNPLTPGGGNPGGGQYFTSSVVNGNYNPGIGRNTFNGPCYFDADMSVAKEFGFDMGDRHMLVRLNANFYNAFNKLQLQPITNGNANAGANIQNQYFGYAQGADAARQIELTGRIQF